MITLVCKEVLFYSECDELSFFEWISKIRSVSKWSGKADEIHLYLPKSTISDKSLRELVALFYRYNIDMRQLEQFTNDRNRRWFADKTKVWHYKVFGSN
jgi:hypothetical protein